MKQTVISLSMVVAAAIPAAASDKFSAADLKGARLKASGRIVISNTADAVRATQTVAKKQTTLVEVRAERRKPIAPPAARSPRNVRVPVSLAAIFEEAATRYSLDPHLLAAVARQESRFQTRAVSPVGARGVMQLMPRTAQELGVTDSFDARQNILGGAKYLRRLLNQFRGDVNLSLAAYNAGPGAVKKYRGIPPYRETRHYVATIRRDYDAARAQ